MSRPIRIQFENAFYHITSRGNRQSDIFLSNNDRRLFQEILKTTVSDAHWICHAFCLMGNHYHLLIETPDANLSAGMRQLNGIYTQSFNRKNQRTGHVFEGRFDSRLVQKDAYLLAVARYVVQNPVRAGIVTHPGSYPWSSYLPTAAETNWVPFLTREFILSQFADDESRARIEYRAFVDDVASPSPWKELRGGVLLGTDEWVGKVERLFKEKWGESEIPWHQKLAARRSLDQIFGDGGSRDRQIYNAYHVHGYKMREISAFLNITVARASQILKSQRKILNKIDLTPKS
jgi:putative transposase